MADLDYITVEPSYPVAAFIRDYVCILDSKKLAFCKIVASDHNPWLDRKSHPLFDRPLIPGIDGWRLVKVQTRTMSSHIHIPVSGLFR